MYTFRDKLYDKAQALGLVRPNSYDTAPIGKLDVPESERSSTPVHEAFYSNQGSLVNKWRHYLDHYHRHLEQFRGTPVRLLEIGVSRGGSLRMWRKYLGPGAIIFGVDVDQSCARFDGEAAQVRIGSQGDHDFLNRTVQEMGGLDVVIDDGSHVASHQLTAFDTLFPKITDNGLYICEDTHTAYWRGYYEGGMKRGTTFIERAKRIIDDLHGDFHRGDLSVKDAPRKISGIHFYNSMVVIEKSPQPPSVSIQVGNSV